MHVLIVSQYWYPENGVPQRRWSWLAQILRDNGHHVTVVAPPPHYPYGVVQDGWQSRVAEFGPSGERIIRCYFKGHDTSLTARIFDQASVGVSSVINGMKAAGISDWGRPDVVIGTVPALPSAIVARLVAKYYKIPYVIDLRDAWPDLIKHTRHWNEATQAQTRKDKLLASRMGRTVLSSVAHAMVSTIKNASALIVTADTLRDNFMKRGLVPRLGKEGIVTIRNVFPSKLGHAEPPRGSGSDFRVLYAGTIGRAQNLMNALHAMNALHQDGIPVSATFIGGGAAKEGLRDFAEAHDLDVTFLRRVPAEEVGTYLNWADTALVHLSDWNPLTWTIPSKTFELMDSGKHITGVVRGEAADLISSLGAGHVAPPNNPVALAELWKELYNDRAKLQVEGATHMWVDRERTHIVPNNLLRLLEQVWD